MVVCNDDLCAFQITKHVVGDKFTTLVIAIWIIGLKHPKPIPDSNARGDYEEAAGESPASGMSHGIDSLPRNEHRHDSGLSCAGGQLQCQTNQFRIGFVVGISKMLKEPLATFACLRSYLGQPNEGLNCFNLAKERPDIAKSMVPPMLK